MKSNNVSNYNEQEKREVLSKIKTYLKDDEFDFTLAALVNYQERSENNTKHYEVYETTILVNENTTVAGINEMRTEKETLVKTYKTKRGFLEAFSNDNDVAGKKYKIYTRL